MTLDQYWVVHDGRVICGVSAKVLLMFRCAEADLVGRDIFEIIPLADMRELARLRMSQIVLKGDMPPQELPFMRCDGEMFWAEVKTERVSAITFISTLRYIGATNPRYNGT